MQSKFLFIGSIMTIILLAACGPAPEATPSIVEIQDTAVAMALTSLAVTKAALPTETPFPTQTPTLAVTSTPFPTLVPPTSAAAAVPTIAEVNPCNEPPPTEPKGTMVRVKFVNKSKGKASLSFGMLQENDKGECGTYNFTIGSKMSPEVTVLAGCYWGWAWITGTEPSIAKSITSICLTDPNQVRGVTITAEVIGFD